MRNTEEIVKTGIADRQEYLYLNNYLEYNINSLNDEQYEDILDALCIYENDNPECIGLTGL